MDTARLIKIILMELTADNLKLEEELEKAINGDMEINTKTQTIKLLLSRIVATEASIAKFTSMMTNNNNNNNNNNQLNQENNGNN
jgi:hypothetical protein